MNENDIQTQIDKITAKLKNAEHHLRASEYVWPKHLAGVKRLRKESRDALKVLREQLDALNGEDESDE